MSQHPPTAACSTNFETIFTAALKTYNKQTKQDIASHPLAVQLQSYDSPSDILTVLRAQVQSLNQSQSAGEKWTKWLDPTVNVLSSFSASLKDVAGPIFPPAAAIFAGIGILLQAVKDVRASQDALIDLFGRMESFFKRLEKYIQIRPTAAMVDIIVKIILEVISILRIVTKEIGQGKTKKFFKKLSGRNDVEDAFRRLDKLTPEEALIVAAETMVTTRDIDDTVRVVDKQLGNINERLKGVDCRVSSVIKGVTETGVSIQHVSNQINDLNRKELRQDLQEWIAPPDPSVNFNTASDAHHEGTAEWCTKGYTVAVWKISGSLLWIYGKPGSGKSILSSVIIQDIKFMSDAGSAFLAYFYFDFKDTEKQDSRALLSSLLVQLSKQSDQFCDVLHNLYSQYKDGSEQPNNASLFRCLKGMLTFAGPETVYLVIDALDECPNDSGIPSSREKVLKIVKELVELRQPNLRLCVTSRPEYDIRTTLESLVPQQVSLHDESGQKQDINDYVTSVLRSDEKMKRWRDCDKDMVFGNLTEKADGMFRWVFCQLEVLRHCFPTNLRHILKELPKSLDETYKRILKDINNANRMHAYRLLQCLTVASRPLRVEELAEVLTFDLSTGGIPKLNADWRWENQEDAVLSACSSLVSVITEAGSRIVQFSHFSVKEFLTSDRLATCMEVSQFRIPIEPSHMIFAKACLGVLLYLDDHTDKGVVEKFPLYQYAAGYWAVHAQVGNVELEIKDALDHFFDVDKPHFSAWARLQVPYGHLTGFIDNGLTNVLPPAAALYCAALNGLPGVIERLIIKHPRHLNVCSGPHGTPLHASVDKGHIKVSQLLFMHGADINSRGADKCTPLHIASVTGHLEITKWLLNHGANPNSLSWHGSTPLHYAAYHRHLEICRMLLEYNAEANSRNDSGSTPFLEASHSGDPDIMWLLLDHNADVHVHDGGGSTPLQEVTRRGLLGAARKLLEYNVDVNYCNDFGHTPLLFASQYGHTNVVQLLLDHNADVYARNEDGDTALHCAAAYGSNLEIARILLERNSEVNSQNASGSTPLHLASEGRPSEGRPSEGRPSEGRPEGNPDLVRLLLDYGADVQVRNLRGNIASEVARGPEQREIVRLLSQPVAE